MNITLRFATEADTPLVLQFIRDLADYEHMLDQIQTTEEILHDWLFVRRTAEVLFAVVDGQEAGFVLFFSHFSTFMGQAGLYMEDLFVKPAYRGMGIGKALIAKLAQTAQQRGCGLLEWTCLDWNQSSIDFYLSRGAKQMREWTVYRLSGDALKAVADNA